MVLLVLGECFWGWFWVVVIKSQGFCFFVFVWSFVKGLLDSLACFGMHLYCILLLSWESSEPSFNYRKKVYNSIIIINNQVSLLILFHNSHCYITDVIQKSFIYFQMINITWSQVYRNFFFSKYFFSKKRRLKTLPWRGGSYSTDQEQKKNKK